MKKHGTVLASLLLLALIIGTIGCGGEEMAPSPTPTPTTASAHTPTLFPIATSVPFDVTLVTPTPTLFPIATSVPFDVTLVTPTPTAVPITTSVPFDVTLVTPMPTAVPITTSVPFDVTLVTPTPTATTIELEDGYSDFTYVAEGFELRIIAPNEMTLSTPDKKRPQPVHLYMKRNGTIPPIGQPANLFEASVEVGVSINLKLTGISLSIFLDVDIELFGTRRPDVFCLEWPIWGVPSLGMPSLGTEVEGGDVGVYSYAVPVKPSETEFDTLSVGEWNHINSYNVYVVSETGTEVWGALLEDITIGQVVSLR